MIQEKDLEKIASSLYSQVFVLNRPKQPVLFYGNNAKQVRDAFVKRDNLRLFEVYWTKGMENLPSGNYRIYADNLNYLLKK